MKYTIMKVQLIYRENKLSFSLIENQLIKTKNPDLSGRDFFSEKI